MKNASLYLRGGIFSGCLTGFEPATSASTVRRSTLELQAPCERRRFYHEYDAPRKKSMLVVSAEGTLLESPSQSFLGFRHEDLSR